MKDRLLEFLKKENISAAEFAETIGVQRSSISHVLSGRNNPSYDFIIKVLTHYPLINPDWLLLGKGTIGRTVNQQSLFIETTKNDELESPQNVENQKENVRLQMSTILNTTGSEDELVENSSEKYVIEKIVIFYSNKTFSVYQPE